MKNRTKKNREVKSSGRADQVLSENLIRVTHADFALGVLCVRVVGGKSKQDKVKEGSCFFCNVDAVAR